MSQRRTIVRDDQIAVFEESPPLDSQFNAYCAGKGVWLPLIYMEGKETRLEAVQFTKWNDDEESDVSSFFSLTDRDIPAE